MPPKRHNPQDAQHDEFYHPDEALDAPPEAHPEAREKTPGVYTREADPQELDMLWSSNPRLYQKEDRSPIVFFLVGFLLGGLVTGLVVFLLMKHPHVKTGDSMVTKPVEEVATPQPAAEAQPDAGQHKALFSLPFGKPKAQTPPDTQPAEQPDTSAQSQPQPTESARQQPQPTESTPVAASVGSAISTYKVQSGDTLGRIAFKYYHSSDPKYIGKLQQANHMKSPDALQIGQTLTIPAP